jgi:uncharacterized protein
VTTADTSAPATTEVASVPTVTAPAAVAPPEEVIDLSGLADAPTDLAYVIVNEAGASDYSASPIAKEEFPNHDATTRGTISIGRRLQDPLAELVKIDPQHVGVGLYQHDLRPKYLKQSLEAVIESCVNHIGVDLNTASVPLLRHVSGLNQLVARELVAFRQTNGAFKNRDQLKNVPQMGDTRFTQSAGFLKIPGGDDPLDATWVHPESYDKARQLLTEMGYTPSDLRDRAKTDELHEKLKGTNLDEMAQKLGITVPTLIDLYDAISKPGRDPRDEVPPPVFKKGILKMEDVTVGMELKGTVLNVVPFGAFVDVGLKESGLVHISQMANRYIKSPYDVVSVGDVVTVWVMEVKPGDKKLSLSMVPPGTEKPAPPPRGPRQEGPRPPRGDRGEGRPPRPQPAPGERPPQQQTDRPQGPGARPGGPRGPRPGGRRFDGPRPGQAPDQSQPQPAAGGAPAQPATPLPPPKPQRAKPIVKLTEEKKTGKAALNTFGELSAFFKTRTDDKPAEKSGEKAAEEPKKDEKPPEQPPAGV